MQEWNARRIAMVCAGCYLGAGYVSGQELWQFFGSHGTVGWLSVVLAIAIAMGFAAVAMLTARRMHCVQMDRVIVPDGIAWLRVPVMLLQMLLLFAIIAIMSAGAGELLKELLGIPPVIGNAVMCLLVFAVSLKGLRGMSDFYSILTPLIILITVVISVLSAVRFGIRFDMPVTAHNPLIPKWWIACVIFTFYNAYCSIGIQTPAGVEARSERSILWGNVISGLILLFVAASVLLAISASDGAWETEMPMVTVAASIAPWLGSVYGVLLMLAMFGVSVSSTVAIKIYAEERIPSLKEHRALAPAVLSAASYGASFGGFSGLVSVLLPLFGYCSAAFLVCMLVNFCIHRKKA